VFLRALRAGPQETFLSIIAKIQAAEEMELQVPPVLESAIAGELRTMHIYRELAARFAHEPPMTRFFAALAGQERSHAELLRICAQASRHARTDARRLAPLAERLAPLQATLARAESALSADVSRDEALRLVVQIEGAEINHLFNDLVAVNPSPFVKAIQGFQKATGSHLAYIRRVLPTLGPEVEAECRTLVA
jgi:hypothetical protein